jgi:cation:H+ antiporter
MIVLVMPLLFLILGMIILTFSSNKTVDHSIALACNWKVPPIFIGLVLVSIGTDLPEIVNSIISSFLGFGNISVGSSIGSVFAQMTLVLGIVALSFKGFEVNKKEVFAIGASTLLVLILSFFSIEDGNISRSDGFFLVVSWVLVILILKMITDKEFSCPLVTKRGFFNFIMVILGFVGVALGTYLVINSILELSRILNISELIVSFFIAAIGTSLPELSVTITAIRKGQYALAIGDIMGSSILDASISIGIGPLLFPTLISRGSAINSWFYTIFAVLIIVLFLSLRGKVDKKIGIICLSLYLFSYSLLFFS